jgi:hypothetical protein
MRCLLEEYVHDVSDDDVNMMLVDVQLRIMPCVAHMRRIVHCDGFGLRLLCGFDFGVWRRLTWLALAFGGVGFGLFSLRFFV